MLSTNNALVDPAPSPPSPPQTLASRATESNIIGAALRGPGEISRTLGSIHSLFCVCGHVCATSLDVYMCCARDRLAAAVVALYVAGWLCPAVDACASLVGAAEAAAYPMRSCER